MVPLPPRILSKVRWRECYVGNISWATVPAYDSSKVEGDPPAHDGRFSGMFEKYPGRRGLRKVPRVNLEWALMADGVANEDSL